MPHFLKKEQSDKKQINSFAKSQTNFSRGRTNVERNICTNFIWTSKHVGVLFQESAQRKIEREKHGVSWDVFESQREGKGDKCEERVGER